MALDPNRFLGRGVSDLLSALRQVTDAPAPPGGVRPHSATVALLDEQLTVRPGQFTTIVFDNTDIPLDHPAISVPGVVLEQLLGSGGQGWVYAGRVAESGRVVAVKVLRGGAVSAGGAAAREARLCGRLRHRNLLRVFSAEEAGDFCVVLMELVQGGEMAPGQPPVAELKPCLGQLADALLSLGAQGIVHRDVKPANVLLRHTDRSPVLVDFGLAVEVAATDDEFVVASAGTPIFMAPESLPTGAFEPKPHPSWDAYALGVTAARLILGKLDDHGDLSRLRTEKLTGSFDARLRERLASLDDREMAGWIGRLIDRDPECRQEALRDARRWVPAEVLSA